MQPNMLNVALDYARRGIPVIPLHTPIIKEATNKVFCTCYLGDECGNKGKHPRYHPTLLTSGIKQASVNPDVITGWWIEWPNANIGLATGNTFIALDCDTLELAHRAATTAGVTSLQTPTIKTGRGVHYLFARPSIAIANKVKLDGFDIRSEGGLIVAPPSLHASGKRYEWLIDLDTPFAPVPDWLYTLLEQASPKPLGASEKRDTTEDTPYGLGALKRATEAVQTAHNGTRNDTLYRETASLYNLVAGGELTPQSVEATMYEAAIRVGLDENEIRKTLSTAKNNGTNNPRNAPHKLQRTTSVDLLAKSFGFTDLGNANRLYALYGADIHYIEHWSTWLVWNDRYWQRDTLSIVDRMAHETVKEILKQSFDIKDDEQRKGYIGFAFKSQNRKQLNDMVAVAKTLDGVKINYDVLDTDQWLLNVNNGTINLRTGKLQTHNKADLITKSAGVTYLENAQAPNWQSFLNTVFNNDRQLIDYVQRAVGYSLTGDTSEDVLNFAYGEGGNGKSTFFNIIEHLLGDYAHKTPSTMLMATKFEGIPVDVADLQGKRFVIASEISKNVRWNEAKIKDLTGGDKLTARYMRTNPFTFYPTHKLWIYGNYKPVVVGSDEGIWRRLRLIPFTIKIPPNLRDKHFEDKLIPELSGILNWALVGCLKWQQDGLTLPKAIDHATNDYREEMDRLQAYIDEYCVVDKAERCLLKTIYGHYEQYCKQHSEYKVEKREFKERLERKGFIVKNGRDNAVFVFGLRPLEDQERRERTRSAVEELATLEV